jgi:hypothetical protein
MEVKCELPAGRGRHGEGREVEGHGVGRRPFSRGSQSSETLCCSGLKILSVSIHLIKLAGILLCAPRQGVTDKMDRYFLPNIVLPVHNRILLG